MRCRAVPCRAVQYSACAVLCRDLPCYVLCCTYPLVHAGYHSHYHDRYRHYSPRCVYTTCYIVGPQKMHSQLSSARLKLSSAAQHCAVPCGAVLCLAVRCGAVLRCAFFRSHSSTRSHAKSRTRYRYVLVYSSFCFLHFLVLSRFSACFRFRKLHPYCR